MASILRFSASGSPPSLANLRRKLAREGSDPLSGRHNHANVPTFAEAAERVWKDNRPGWRHSGHAQEWMSSLARHVLPYIGG